MDQILHQQQQQILVNRQFSNFVVDTLKNFSLKIYLASSVSPTSTTSHKRHSTASVIAAHPKQNYHHHMPLKSALKITYHRDRSDPSSSDDGMTSHDVTSGLQMVHNETIAHAGLITEAIELSTVSSSSGHRLIDYEDSNQTTTTSTFSPKTVSSDHETIETNLSASTTIDTIDDTQSRSKRSRSYHGQGFDNVSMLSNLDVLKLYFLFYP
jgi:hypothetical protein